MSRSISLRSFISAERAARRPAEIRLVDAGRFDRAGIMRKAVAVARSINRRFGSWQARMAIGLKTAWKAAREAMTQVCAVEPFAVREPALARPYRPAFRSYRPRAFILGSRATSHGW